MKNIIGKILYAFAEELLNFEIKLIQLMNESFPGLAIDLLPEWERDLGLPDEDCKLLVQTLEERQIAAHAKFVVSYTGQSRAFFITYAAELGFTITITEYFGVGSGFRVDVNRVDRDPVIGVDGSRLWGLTNRHRWTVNILTRDVISIEYLQCRFERLKPAQTIVTWNDLT